MPVALTIDELEIESGSKVDGPTARALLDAAQSPIFLLVSDGHLAPYLGTGRLDSIARLVGTDRYLVTFAEVVRLPNELTLAASSIGTLRLQLFDAGGPGDSLSQTPTASSSGASDVTGFAEMQSDFNVGTPDLPTFTAVIETLWRETGGRCAFTGEPSAPGTIPVVICPRGAHQGLHVNNLLLLGHDAGFAFSQGYWSALDDLTERSVRNCVTA